MSNDTVNGPTNLATPTLNAVTGGNVTSCGVVRFNSGYLYGLETCYNGYGYATPGK